MWLFLMQGVGYGFSAALQPGPFQAYLLAQTTEKGWRRALPASLAPLVSDGPIVLLSLLVLSQIPAWFQRALCLAGGAFVLYLARGAFGAWRMPPDHGGTIGSAERQSVLKAALTNALSPGPYLYWSLVTGPILLRAWRVAPTVGVGFLVSFYITLILSLVGLILVFGIARRLGPRVNHALLGISALALLGFGCYQLWLGVVGVV